jgi:hypothetical protein
MIDDGAIRKQRKRVGLVHPMLLPSVPIPKFAS